MIWLIFKEMFDGENALTGALYSLIRKLTRSKRWSRSISQYNLKSSSFESEPYRCLKLLGMDEMMRQMHVNRKDLNVDLQGFIFKHLREKAQKIKKDLNVCDKNVRSKIIGQRGDGVLEGEGLLRDYEWCTTDIEFNRSILIWHLATDICYLLDKDESNVSKEYEASRCLSEYMMYLLVIRPNMLSKGFGDDEEYQETLRRLRRLFSDLKYPLDGHEYTLQELWGLKELQELQDLSYDYDYRVFQSRWKLEKSVLRGVERLARQLRSLESKKRWEMINEVWIEMVAYAAAQCPWKEHIHQLRRGGELLTHVSLLMLHLGLTEQYEYNLSNEKNFVLKGEEQEEYNNAKDKYLNDTADMLWSSPDEVDEEEYFQASEDYLKATKIMSGTSPNEELKKLEKIVADRKPKLEREKRKLELKERKLEQWRSLIASTPSLIASTPQQGFDSLPRSLPAQTDDQGTGQPPSNNEISLNME